MESHDHLHPFFAGGMYRICALTNLHTPTYTDVSVVNEQMPNIISDLA